MFQRKPTNNPKDPSRYYFAHIYLPRMLLEFPQKMYENLANKNGNDFLHYLWGKAAEEASSKSPSSELKLFYEKIDSTHEVFVIQMPKPQVTPEAIFGAAVFGLDYFSRAPKVITIRYFTLEIGQNPYESLVEYHFCEWSTLKEHTNYGQLAKNDIRTFLQAIFSKIKT